MPITKPVARLVAVCVACGFAVACGSDKAVTGPSQSVSAAPSTASISVTGPSGTIFIGSTAQLEARESLSDGTARAAASASWSSDNTAVANVSPSGLVTAVAAGEAMIAADAGGTRGTLRIRVYPDFGGAWTGSEVVSNCVDAGAFAGFCAAAGALGQTGVHHGTFSQNAAAVNAVIDPGDETTITMNGTITVGGELGLGSAPALPADPELNFEIENWRSRADVPSRMTGTYDVLLTAPGVQGLVRISIRLQNVVKSAAAPKSAARGEATASLLARRVGSRLRQR